MADRGFVMWLHYVAETGSVSSINCRDALHFELEALRAQILEVIQVVIQTGASQMVKGFLVVPRVLPNGLLLLTIMCQGRIAQFIPCICHPLQGLHAWDGVAGSFCPVGGGCPQLAQGRFNFDAQTRLRQFTLLGGRLPILRSNTACMTADPWASSEVSVVEEAAVRAAMALCAGWVAAARFTPGILCIDQLRVHTFWTTSRNSHAVGWQVNIFSADGNTTYQLFCAWPHFVIWDGVLAVRPNPQHLVTLNIEAALNSGGASAAPQ